MSKKNKVRIIALGILLTTISFHTNIKNSKQTQGIYPYTNNSIKSIKKEVEYYNKTKIREEYKKILKQRSIKIKTPSRGIRLSTPNNNTSFKSYMNYKKVTNRDSQQYKVLHHITKNGDNLAYTDDFGMRRYKTKEESDINNDMYFVALGSYYGVAGDVVKIKFKHNEILAIIGDLKADEHTDNTNRQHLSDNSVVEFLIGKRNKMLHFRQGDISYLGESMGNENNFKGNVLEIEKLNINILNY